MSNKLHFVASSAPAAQDALLVLRRRYGDAGQETADIIVALGGDGFMLETVHAVLGQIGRAHV